MDAKPKQTTNQNQLQAPKETYKELTMYERPYIEEIVRQVKAPYPAFHKRVKLKHLVELLNEIWEDEDF